jgi:hypothetical protein
MAQCVQVLRTEKRCWEQSLPAPSLSLGYLRYYMRLNAATPMKAKVIRMGHPIAIAFALILVSVRAHASPSSFGGVHAGYAIGGSIGQTNAGLRHGLDLSFMPYLVVTERGGGRDSVASDTGYTFGPSAFIGFGDTPNYLAFDFGYAGSSIIGAFAGFGPVYRIPFEKMPAGYGFEGRLAFDFVFIDSGIRMMSVFGDHSSEFVATIFLGLGRF